MGTVTHIVRFYTCPRCCRLLVTAADGGPAPHDCVIPTEDEPILTEELKNE